MAIRVLWHYNKDAFDTSLLLFKNFNLFGTYESLLIRKGMAVHASSSLENSSSPAGA